MDSNLKDWIIEEADGGVVEAVVIGEAKNTGIPGYGLQPLGKVLTWLEAIRWIDYWFDSGYGSIARCNAIYAWTKSKVIFVHEYDGSTRIRSVPRNPCQCEPEV